MSQGNSLIRAWGSCIYILGRHPALHTLTRMVFQHCVQACLVVSDFANLWTVACQTTLVICRCLKKQKRFWLHILFDPLAVIPSSLVLLIFALGISDRSHSCMVIKVHCEIVSLLYFIFSLNLCNVNIHRLSSQHLRVMVAWFSERKFGKERFVFGSHCSVFTSIPFSSSLGSWLWSRSFAMCLLVWGKCQTSFSSLPTGRVALGELLWPWSSLYLKLWIQKSNSWIHVLIVGDLGQFSCYDSDSSSI